MWESVNQASEYCEFSPSKGWNFSPAVSGGPQKRRKLKLSAAPEVPTESFIGSHLRPNMGSKTRETSTVIEGEMVVRLQSTFSGFLSAMHRLLHRANKKGKYGGLRGEENVADPNLSAWSRVISARLNRNPDQTHYPISCTQTCISRNQSETLLNFKVGFSWTLRH